MEEKLDVRGKEIRMKKIKGNEMFSLTDIANQFGTGRAGDKLFAWFKNHNTLDFLEAYEEENNPNCKKRNLKKIIKAAKENKNALRLEDFEKATNSPFISARNKNEGMWAVFEISAKFMMWIHAKFEVWFMKDYKKMKIEETKMLLQQDKFFAQKDADNLMESLRNAQDRLDKIQKELEG